MPRRSRPLPLAVALCAGFAAVASAQTWRASVDSNGIGASGYASFGSINGDGTVVAFASQASNLVPSDTNFAWDIFVHQRPSGLTTRVNVTNAGFEADSDSFDPSITPDGRHVAFESNASNLVPGDTNGFRDIYVRDRQAGTTVRASLGIRNSQPNADCFHPDLSDDGRYVVFSSAATNLVSGDNNGQQDVFVRDLVAGTTTLVSRTQAGTVGNDRSWMPRISGDGVHVAFSSDASDLVTTDTNGLRDVFVARLAGGVTVLRASVGPGGVEADGDSDRPDVVAGPTGAVVVFESRAQQPDRDPRHERGQ